MRSEKALLRDLGEMSKLTSAGKLNWDIKVSTTEYNDEKPMISEEGTDWTVDECYVSYHCEYKGDEFLMITYEMIHSAGDKKKTTNLVFLPPLGIRYFDLHAMLPYAIETSQMLTYNVHMLWLLILEQKKKNPNQIQIDADSRSLTIED